MAQFVVTGQGSIDLRATNLTGFDGLAFNTSGNATVLLTGAQAIAFGATATFTGGSFRDTVDIRLTVGQTVNGFSWNLASWNLTRDSFRFLDSTGNESITGTFGNDIFTVTQGLDAVAGLDGTPGSIDTLICDWATDVGSFSMASASGISDFQDTSVSFSGIERFDIRLGLGNDNVNTGTGDDTLSGGAGNDTLNGGTGADTMDGGDGNDVWQADFSATATARTVNLNLGGVQSAGTGITYTNFEQLNVAGGAGNDRFESRTGNANDGLRDTLNGGLGNDTLVVGGGNDQVAGGDGDDLLIIDWSTDDNAFSMASATAISDFANTSVTYSGIERIDLRLGSGSDNVSTGAGDDTLSGGTGNDTLDSGAGIAVVDGGTGNDVWTANFSADATAKTVNLNLAGLQNAGNGSTYVNIEQLNIIGGSANDRFETRTGNANDGLRDTLNGGLGNDTLVVGGGNDQVAGGDGDDLLIIDWSTDNNAFGMASPTAISDFANTSVTYSGIERIDLRLGSGSDNVSTGAGDDTLSGGLGNDTLDSGTGRADVNGGDGNDVWTANFSADATAKTVNLNLAGGQLAGNGSTYVNIEQLNIIGGSANDRFETRTGNANDGLRDTLNGGLGNDTLVVGGGNDQVAGGDGDDLLIIDWSTDNNAFGMASPTAISDFANTSVTYSGIERIDLRLGSGNDSVSTGAGDDTLSGGLGNDTLDSGTGRADVNGGDGTDLWIVDFTGASVARVINLNLAGRQAAGNGTFYEAVERLSALGGNGNDVLTTRTDNANDTLGDTLNGGAGNDTLTVGGGNDQVSGGDGDDLLIIDFSTDTSNFGNSSAIAYSDFFNTSVSFSEVERLDIRLGSGNDNITAGTGDDTVNGGAGNDTLNGNTGVNTLDFTGATASVRITATGAGTGTATGTATGTDTYTAFTAFTLTNLADRFEGGTDATVTDGGAGRDTLEGNSGNDTLIGGAGADRLIGGRGQDELTGGADADRFVFGIASHLGKTEGRADLITDFSQADLDQIDVSGLHAAGSPFTWLGTGAFTALGQVQYYVSGGDTFIALNTRGDLAADYFIRLEGEITLAATDLIL